MSASLRTSQAEAAAAYERYISENWDRLQPFEREQARSYLEAKQLAAQQPQSAASSMYQQPGFGDLDPMYGGAYGLYGGFGLSRRKEEEGTWAVPVGYIGVLFFTPLAIGCGIYNITKGRTGHGLAQIFIPIGLFVLYFMIISASV